MSILKTTIRWVLSVGIFVLAAIVGHRLWVYYNSEPWTRDARVRADVAEIAPDVSGLVDTVNVIDNQTVKVGDVLFTIDKRRFEIAKSRAIDAVNQLNVEIAQARRENLRNKHLDDLVSDEGREESQAKLDQEIAARDQAQTALEEAELNLTRSEVKSPIDGIVTNIELQPGDYATTGKPEFAILATDSVRIEGYFEETKLRDIRVGDRAKMSLMGDNRVFYGRVESIAAGVEDHDRASSSRFLANINPTFNWVRLAQRIPVRIKVDQKPADLALLSGRTATVRILPDAKGAP
jgi:RND family efflux transporter MFP subunit